MQKEKYFIFRNNWFISNIIKDTALCGLGQSAPNPVLSTLKYFVDPSVNPWTHPYVLYLGKEPFHFIFKYIVSFFSTDSRFFAGVAAATYAFIFLSFFLN